MVENKSENSRLRHQRHIGVGLFFLIALSVAACGDNSTDASTDAEVDIQGSPSWLDVPQSVEFPRAGLPARPESGAEWAAWREPWKMARVHNAGDKTLIIDRIEVKGERQVDRYGGVDIVSDFSFSIPQPTDAELAGGDSPDPDNDIARWPESLAPGASFDVRVSFNNRQNRPVADELIFETNDPLKPVYSVALLGNSDSPCMVVIPGTRIDFGSGSIGQESRKTIGMKNCSQTKALNIQDIEITDAAGGVFEVDPASLPDAFPAEPLVIGVGERANFRVIYRPTQEVASVGSLRITSNDLLQPMNYRALTGHGIDNACPVAVASARSVHVYTPPSSVLEVPPLTTVQLDASASSAASGSIRRYEWTLLSSPATSSATIENTFLVNPTFELDVVGDYKFELKVYDEQNTISCAEPAIVTVKARPTADIYIQLTWRNPDVPWGTGSSDLDLHYLHPNSDRWGSNSDGWDCYYRNSHPDWLIPDGSPIWIGNELRGNLHEVIRHNNLEYLTYRVGVDYFSDFSAGPANATVEIYARGALRYAARDKRLTRDQFWLVAYIQGANHIVVPVDTIIAGNSE